MMVMKMVMMMIETITAVRRRLRGGVPAKEVSLDFTERKLSRLPKPKCNSLSFYGFPTEKNIFDKVQLLFQFVYGFLKKLRCF